VSFREEEKAQGEPCHLQKRIIETENMSRLVEGLGREKDRREELWRGLVAVLPPGSTSTHAGD